jgi:hypothetical protein
MLFESLECILFPLCLYEYQIYEAQTHGYNLCPQSSNIFIKTKFCQEEGTKKSICNGLLYYNDTVCDLRITMTRLRAGG